MKPVSRRATDRYKIGVMTLLVIGSLGVAYCCHAMLKVDTVFTHLFYIPIILASLWWQRKGVVVAVLPAAGLVISHLFLRGYVGSHDDYLRAGMFIVVAIMTAALSERIKKGERERERVLRDLQKRVKELTCMHGIAEAARGNRPMSDILANVVKMIPPSWQYPDIARARVRFGEQEYVSQPFEQTKWAQSSDITVDGHGQGMVEVYYLQQRPEADEGPFQKEERLLLDSIAHTLSQIAQHKTVEESLRMSEKLAATGRLAAGIAHEINNPLAGIKNSFLLIKDAVPQDHPQYEYVGRIQNEIDRIARIVRQMFELYRPHRDVPGDFMLDVAIWDVVTLLESHCRVNRVKINVEISETSTLVYLPKDSVFQILFNILKNAIDASPQDSQVTVGVATEENHVSISVTDKGSGIPEDLRSRVFEPFFTTKNTSGTAEAGLGLGLSVCESLVGAMGGSLDFQSRADQGTTFRVLLPRTHHAARSVK